MLESIHGLLPVLLAAIVSSVAFTKASKGALEAGLARARGAYNKLPMWGTAIVALIGAFSGLATSPESPSPEAVEALVKALGALLSMGGIAIVQAIAGKPTRPADGGVPK